MSQDESERQYPLNAQMMISVMKLVRSIQSDERITSINSGGIHLHDLNALREIAPHNQWHTRNRNSDDYKYYTWTYVDGVEFFVIHNDNDVADLYKKSLK